MSSSPGGTGRESPSSTASSTTASGGSGSVIGSLGSGSNGCRNSGASFDSGRATATSTTFQGVRYSAGLSSESSLGSLRHSYHSSSSSLGSIPSDEIRNFDVAGMISQGVPDHEILNAWLTGLHLECYYQNFVQAGYDMQTISRMTPEDLNAIGVTKPHHRKKIKSEISQLNISEGLPDYIPESLEEWLRLLRLEEYLPRLLDQGYRNVRQVTNITWEDLDDIGILKLGHQKKFMLAIKRVQDIVSGKRFPPAHAQSPYSTSLESFQHSSHQPVERNLSTSSMPYQPIHPVHQPNNSSSSSQMDSSHYQKVAVDPRNNIHRNMWPQSQLYQNHVVGSSAISHQIQIHHPPPAAQAPHASQNQAVQPLYHPEVISIRVKNGHPSNSLDSPPEEEPIYGTSSFQRNPPPPAPSSNHSSWMNKPAGGLRSFEEGESPQTNGHVAGNLSMTKQSMSNTWTLPRLQKHKPINKVMGGGMTNSGCEPGVVYPGPQQINPPVAPAPPIPSVSTFGKSEYATVKCHPPPPPRRSSCSSLAPDSELPLPPPPPLAPTEMALVNTEKPHVIPQASEPYKVYSMSSSYYGQRPTPSTNSYPNMPLVNKPGGLHNGVGGRSTLPMTKSRDASPARSDFVEADLSHTNGILCRGVKRNGSDASFKSNSSTESESIPFANDNAGTIKQQKAAARPAQSTGQQGDAGDVLSDIGSMLADLTDQLDAILEQERTSKR